MLFDTILCMYEESEVHLSNIGNNGKWTTHIVVQAAQHVCFVYDGIMPHAGERGV